ncbi:MAG: hypothetical protein NC916_01635 [Candidatus Omnitrophica bacterium]|nr:hypothetical protein [Candidatus Omnitrophota bacterium]
MKRCFFIIFIFVLFLFNQALALDLNITEGKVRLSIKPGEAKSGVINIRNSSSDSIPIKAYLEDWYYLPQADGTKEFKPAGTTEISCAPWITFSPAEFIIPAFGKQVVNYTVRVPQDATGGHYAVLFFESQLAQQSEPQEGVGLGVAVRMGSLFYVEAEGTIKREAALYNLSVERASGNLPLTVSLSLTNIGNVDITADGTFHLIDKSGMVFARGNFNEVYTLPNDKGLLKGDWQEEVPAGIYDLVLTIDLEKALEQVGMPKTGATLVKEAEVEIGHSGEVKSFSSLR